MDERGVCSLKKTAKIYRARRTKDSSETEQTASPRICYVIIDRATINFIEEKSKYDRGEN